MFNGVYLRQVTSVKLSPSARYILLGAGVRARYSEARGDVAPGAGEGQQPGTNGSAGAQDAGVGMASSQAPVTSIYRTADLESVVSDMLGFGFVLVGSHIVGGPVYHSSGALAPRFFFLRYYFLPLFSHAKIR